MRTQWQQRCDQHPLGAPGHIKTALETAVWCLHHEGKDGVLPNPKNVRLMLIASTGTTGTTGTTGGHFQCRRPQGLDAECGIDCTRLRLQQRHCRF